MNDDFERRHSALMDRLRQKMRQPDPAVLLGSYIAARLERLNIDKSTFANTLDMDSELLDDILGGELPASLISDTLLVDMADALGRDADILRVMLGRPVSLNSNPSSNAPAGVPRSPKTR